MATPRGLHTLAVLHGVQTVYHDNDGRRVRADAESLLEVLRALGVDVRDAARLPELAALRRRELWERAVEPVVVARAVGRGTRGRDGGWYVLRLPAALRDAPVRATVTLEEGGELVAEAAGGALEVAESAEVDGRAFVALRAPLPALPAGYHDLAVEVGRGAGVRRLEALVIAAPQRAVAWDGATGARGWGVFAPLYALHEESAPDALPDFGLLDRLAGAVAGHGGSVVGTLPLLAAFLDEPYEPSPYAPVSRLFWNELYAVPPEAPAPEVAGAAGGELFDPGAAMAARRPALEAAARSFFAAGSAAELEPYLARNPRALDYARFRALVARHGSWDGWLDRLRARDIRPGDYDEDVARYHLYVQWLTERQLTEARERAGSRGVGLYLDLPLGVHPRGYDVWRDRGLFATRLSAGAPPDALAAGGQDWGFPPMHPEASRLDRHRYFVSAIRTHLRFARVLRIDHVMQLHRMFWVPGGDARRGVYVRYPARELHAILCLESHRAGAVIVGEDLGTVPRAVRRDMRRHGLAGMYVAQFELTEGDAAGGGRRSLVPRPVPAGALASVGTHDTPMFAGWWHGRDADEGDGEGRGRMRAELARGLELDGDPSSSPAAAEVHVRLLERLGRSPAGLVLATLEDLWLEERPQNVPGTTRPENWRGRAARPIEALGRPPAADTLRRLNASREGDG